MSNDNKNNYDILVLGGGPAGLTAAVYTSRAQLKTLVVAGQPSGGQLMTTTEVENFPGFPQGIRGPELIQNMRDQAGRFGTTVVDENVTSISGTFAEGFTIETDTGNKYFGKAVILALGASAKWLGLESEQKLRGRGVSACATCDGYFFKGKTVAVVGGGDASFEEAIFLTNFAPKVYLIARKSKNQLAASKYMQERAFANPKIEFVFNTQVVEVLGGDNVEGIKIINNQTNEVTVLDDVKGLFVSIGHKPNTDFLQGFVELVEKGYIKVLDTTRTSKEGVFVAGDVSDYRYRQAITASGLGCMAALDVEKFLAERKELEVNA